MDGDHWPPENPEGRNAPGNPSGRNSEYCHIPASAGKSSLPGNRPAAPL